MTVHHLDIDVVPLDGVAPQLALDLVCGAVEHCEAMTGRQVVLVIRPDGTEYVVGIDFDIHCAGVARHDGSLDKYR